MEMELVEKEDHQCSFCDFKSALKTKFEQHIRLHTQEKPCFLCDQCNRGFSSKSGLNEHKLCVHQGIKKVYKKKYKCFVCPCATYHKNAWATHTQAHLGERMSFPCQHPGCRYAAKTSSSLRLHIINVHKNDRKFLCNFPDCGYRGKTTGRLKQHFETHSEGKTFVCDIEGCNYRAKRKPSLLKHKRGVHNDGYKPFACSLCNYCTTFKSTLTKHELIHSEEKPIKCNFMGCDFSCKTNESLTLHVLNRHTDKKFKCDVEGCLSTAASLSKLQIHKKNAHSEKAYQCPTCDFRAGTPWNLKAHVDRGHNASQRIPCPTKGCTFQAKNRDSLNDHLRYHKANLGCPLEGCSYVGHSSPSLKRHMELHDPTGRPFPCPLCSKYFSTNHSLSGHLKSHTQEKPFQCPACNYETLTKYKIRRHMGLLHPTISSKFDQESICSHCNVNFGSAVGLEMHKMEFKTAVVVLTRVEIKM